MENERMDNGSRIIPEHIRNNLKKFSPNISDIEIICLECGYRGQMGFTTRRSWDLGSFFNTFFWGLLAFGLLLTVLTGGGFLVVIALAICAYWCLKNIFGNKTKYYHCPNCEAVLSINRDGQHLNK